MLILQRFPTLCNLPSDVHPGFDAGPVREDPMEKGETPLDFLRLISYMD